MTGGIDPVSQAIGEMSARVHGVEIQLGEMRRDHKEFRDVFSTLRDDLNVIKTKFLVDQEEESSKLVHANGRRTALIAGIVSSAILLLPNVWQWLFSHK